MRYKYLYFLCLVQMLTACLFFTGHAQTILKGIVIDSVTREPLSYVSIAEINNSTAKTITDQFGYFSLKTSNLPAESSASFLGYKTITVATNGQENIQIQLKQD